MPDHTASLWRLNFHHISRVGEMTRFSPSSTGGGACSASCSSSSASSLSVATLTA